MITLLDKIQARQKCLHSFENFPELETAFDILKNALANDHKLLIFGNGGSATQSAHFAAELVNKFYKNRKALAALSLAVDLACITAISNDSHSRFIFSRQIEALGQPGDVAIGLTTSGTSPNVLEAFQLSCQKGLKTVALCGRNTRELTALNLDAVLSIAADDTPLIQEMHLFIIHILAEKLELTL
jgi:D-sedoheptulose 7-phosphate isomerase